MSKVGDKWIWLSLAIIIMATWGLFILESFKR